MKHSHHAFGMVAAEKGIYFLCFFEKLKTLLQVLPVKSINTFMLRKKSCILGSEWLYAFRFQLNYSLYYNRYI